MKKPESFKKKYFIFLLIISAQLSLHGAKRVLPPRPVSLQQKLVTLKTNLTALKNKLTLLQEKLVVLKGKFKAPVSTEVTPPPPTPPKSAPGFLEQIKAKGVEAQELKLKPTTKTENLDVNGVIKLFDKINLEDTKEGLEKLIKKINDASNYQIIKMAVIEMLKKNSNFIMSLKSKIEGKKVSLDNLDNINDLFKESMLLSVAAKMEARGKVLSSEGPKSDEEAWVDETPTANYTPSASTGESVKDKLKREIKDPINNAYATLNQALAKAQNEIKGKKTTLGAKMKGFLAEVNDVIKQFSSWENEDKLKELLDTLNELIQSSELIKHKDATQVIKDAISEFNKVVQAVMKSQGMEIEAALTEMEEAGKAKPEIVIILKKHTEKTVKKTVKNIVKKLNSWVTGGINTKDIVKAESENKVSEDDLKAALPWLTPDSIEKMKERANKSKAKHPNNAWLQIIIDYKSDEAQKQARNKLKKIDL